MKRDMSDVIKYLKFHLCWFDFTDSRFSTLKARAQQLRLLIMIILWCGSALSAYLEGLTKDFDGKYFLVTITITSWCHSLVYCLESDRAVRITKNLQQLLKKQNEDWQNQILEHAAKISWIPCIAYETLLGIFAFVYFISPVLIDFVLALISPDTPMFKVPLSFDAFLGDIQKRSFRNYFVIVLTGVWHIETMLVNCGAFVIINIFVTYITSLIKILIKKIENFSTKIEQRNAYYNPVLRQDDTAFIKELIQDHVILIKTCEDLKSFLGFTNATQNAIAAICLCITMISSLNLLNKNEYFLVVTNVSCVWITVIIVFCSCFIGEYLQTQNTRLYRAICNMPWYTLNAKDARDLNFIMIHASRKRSIDFHGLSDLTLHTFMQIMNTGYSYFMVLKSKL